MTTQDAVMTTQDVANRFMELAQSGQWQQIQDELFSDDAMSIEPDHSPGLKTVQGREAITQKGKQFQEMTEEVHGGYTSEPLVAGRHFSVAMGIDATMKERGRMNMDEICVYEVKDGKIVKEQFFF